jgi:hypothetical protein
MQCHELAHHSCNRTCAGIFAAFSQGGRNIGSKPPGEKTEKMDKIDKILSVEGVNLDKEAAATVTTALLDELTALKRFEQVGMIESPDTKNPGMGVFPAMMSWDQISRLCDANGIDAIIALSFFDTGYKRKI